MFNFAARYVRPASRTKLSTLPSTDFFTYFLAVHHFMVLKCNQNVCPETHYLPKYRIFEFSSSKYVAAYLIPSVFSLQLKSCLFCTPDAALLIQKNKQPASGNFI